MLRICLMGLLSWCLACTASAADAQREQLAPEAASGFSQQKVAVGRDYMVVTANPHASEAAAAVLARGGSAVDATIAAQMVLGLVEPQSSGIGGGGFLLHWSDKEQRLRYFDGRETAPQKATENHFMGADSRPQGFFDAVVGGHAVGAPGLLHMLHLAHQQAGRLPWSVLFEAAIELSNVGFNVSPRLHQLLKKTPHMQGQQTMREYFYNAEGEPRAIGSLLQNPEYAKTLKSIASQGVDAFYRGPIAGQMVAVVQADPRRSGLLTLTDLANYRAKVREPLCGQYRDYKVCGAAAPSSGGATVLSILGQLQNFDVTKIPADSAPLIHLLAEASHQAFADRNVYLADPDFVVVPELAMIDTAYLRDRAAQIDPSKAMGQALPGRLPGPEQIKGETIELPSTTHLVVVDRYGDAVSMTSSIENAFGARLMVAGFLLNNQLTDFSFVPQRNGKPVANRIQAGKRPRSSMAPMMVFNERGLPVLLLGSPGGSRIINYVARSLIYHLDYQWPIERAIAAPHWVARNRARVELESQRFSAAIVAQLQGYGHQVKQGSQTSGLHGISIDWHNGERHLRGGADPRREGVPLGR